jgi:diguanylate cyclase
MEYLHPLEQANIFSGRAFALMAERGISPDPNNYTIWYNYVTGDHPDLRHAMDLLIDNNHPFTTERSAAVFNRFCGSPYEAVPLHLIAEKMEGELAAVLAAVEQAGRNACSYGQSLERVHDLVGAVQRSDDLKSVISSILAKTRAVVHQSRDVETRLRQAAAEVQQLREELESARSEALTDALTGLGNRKMFDYALRNAVMQAVESGEPLALIMIDIDHFKNFNDTYGHVVGDQVLRLLAVVLKDAIKGQDTATRYGGEEFAIILPRTSAKDAAKLAETIRQRVMSKSMVHRKTGEQLGRVSVSAGVTGLEAGEPMRKFIERADRALYQAKRSGRNRVVSDAEPESVPAGG